VIREEPKEEMRRDFVNSCCFVNEKESNKKHEKISQFNSTVKILHVEQSQRLKQRDFSKAQKDD
jgi:hypothetical protein